MSSVIKYFKRKLNPFKKCVDNQSNSFETNCKNEAEEITSKKKQNKFRLNNIIHRKIKKSISNFVINEELFKVEQAHSESFSNDEHEIERNAEQHHALFNTPVSASLSIDQAASQTRRLTFKSKPNMMNALDSCEQDEKFNSPSSCFTYNVPSCSSNDNTYFMTDSIINSTPTMDKNSFSSSMVTYNTKYQKSIDEDGSISISVLVSPQLTNANDEIQQQQSTPFTESYAKIKNLKTTKSSDNESKKLNQTSNNATNNSNKCRRSNTTYTVVGSKSNYQIIEYFNKLELSKPTKKQAVIRKLREDSKENDKAVNLTNESVKVEKIQDVLFYDESCLSNQDESFDTNMSLNNNAGTITQNGTTFNSTVSTSSSSSSASVSPKLADTSKAVNESKSLVNINETHLVNSSVEKLRRSISFPALTQITSPILSNDSKVSLVKDCQEDGSVDETKQSELAEKETLTKKEENLNISNSKKQKQVFVRGDPQTRVSKNIKQMFKHVVKYQMNALNSLENFYESQIAKLELDRQRNISINPHNLAKINEYFDYQIKILEDRVHTNLKFICDNKNGNQTTNEQQPNQPKNTLSRRLSQIMLLKQLEMQKKRQEKQSPASIKIHPTANQRTSRSNLVALKTSLLASNQNNILPSKKFGQQQQKQANFEFDDLDSKENLFKRNLSLPYQQCKQNAILFNMELTNRINRNNNIRLARAGATSRPDSNRKFSQTHSLSINPTEVNRLKRNYSNSAQSNVDSTTHATKISQYQKNSKKFSSSNENVSKLKFPNLSDLSSIANSITRQNKSSCSLKTDQSSMSITQVTADEFTQSGFSNSSKLSISLSKSNHSFFSQNNTLELTQLNNHLVKHYPPRFSDSHILFKLNQQKQQAALKSTESNIASNLNNFLIQNDKPFDKYNNFLIETEV